jgi:cyclopropane fatty-acyl-phospholipid synthase-like methyltransferase
MKKDLFAHKSKSWDMNSKRVKNAKTIASVIAENVALSDDMHLLDIGAGTGLLSFFLSQKVGAITAVDNSPSMLAMFKEKQDEFLCKTAIEEIDIASTTLNQQFDGIVSSMTIHHVEDTPKLFADLHGMLQEGGFIALADLEREDGSFHSDNEGVHHFGFDTDQLKRVALESGFKDVVVYESGVIKKPHRAFCVFCLIGYK